MDGKEAYEQDKPLPWERQVQWNPAPFRIRFGVSRLKLGMRRPSRNRVSAKHGIAFFQHRHPFVHMSISQIDPKHEVDATFPTETPRHPHKGPSRVALHPFYPGSCDSRQQDFTPECSQGTRAGTLKGIWPFRPGWIRKVHELQTPVGPH
jgi:hypothetical protein